MSLVYSSSNFDKRLEYNPLDLLATVAASVPPMHIPATRLPIRVTVSISSPNRPDFIYNVPAFRYSGV